MREPRVVVWAGGEHPFLLRIGEMLALEKAVSDTVGAVFGRLASTLVGDMRWGTLDVTETIRLGLVGGGMDRVAAQRLIESTADRVGLLALAPVALAALHASLASEEQDEPEAEPDPKSKRRAGSTKPPSSALAR